MGRVVVALLAQETPFNPLGDDLLAYIVLALGGALFFGNVAAVVRPPVAPDPGGQARRAPLARSLVMALLGLVAAVWALASLIA